MLFSFRDKIHLLSLMVLAVLLLHSDACADDAKFPTRAAWTTSRITGSPEPPAPFRPVRVYPNIELKQPVEMVFPTFDSRPFVVERGGKIYRLPADRSSKQVETFFDGPSDIKGLTAVYGLAFAPDFKRSRLCYVCYILEAGLEDGTHVSRFKVTDTDPPRIDPSTEEILLRWRSGGHNGGSLKFGPDGFLYVSTGDGSPPSPPDVHETGQDVSDLLASVLRIDVSAGKSYAVPKDNPFVGHMDARPEVWAYGFRNPWRMSFDRKSGELWLGDVGWQLWEMVYRVQRGGNYGWSIKEGPQSVRPELAIGPTEILSPVVAHPRSEAASVTGGYVYRGKRHDDLVGRYVYGDYVTGKIWSLDPRKDAPVYQELVDTSHAIIAFAEDQQGELYFMDYNGGTIHQLEENKVDASSVAKFPTKLSETGLFASVNDHSPADGVIPFSVNVDQWMDGAVADRFVAVPGNGTMKLRLPEGRVPTDWGDLPKDTVLVKTISVPMPKNGNDATRYRRVETQILHLNGQIWRGNSGEWFGYSYLWNEDQTNATLVPSSGASVDVSLGENLKRKWRIPSRTECYQCHNPWAGYRLAFNVAQLNRPHDYGRGSVNQLAALKHANVISLDEYPADKISNRELVDPHDATADLGRRARSYLHVNCAHCHRFGGGGTATIDLQFNATLTDMRAIDVRPTQGTFDIPQARIIHAGDPYRSVLYYRMAKLGRGRMPYIGSTTVDDRGRALIRDWIAGLDHANGKVTASMEYADALSKLSNGNDSEQAVAAGLLLASTDGAALLADRMFAGRVSKQVSPAVLQSALKSPQHIREELEPFMPEEMRPKRLGVIANADEILRIPGNAAAGQKLFADVKAVQCQNCHRIGETGKNVGPNLSSIGRTMKPREILTSILQPSKDINPKYRTFVIETTSGKVLSGLIVSQNKDVVKIIDAQNQVRSVDRKDIDLIVPKATSMMPDLLYRDLSPQQLADLLAYLAVQKQPVPDGKSD